MLKLKRKIISAKMRNENVRFQHHTAGPRCSYHPEGSSTKYKEAFCRDIKHTEVFPRLNEVKQYRHPEASKTFG
jgi:hypothetical protein